MNFEGQPVHKVSVSITGGVDGGVAEHALDDKVQFLVSGRVVAVKHKFDKNEHLERQQTVKVLEVLPLNLASGAMAEAVMAARKLRDEQTGTISLSEDW